MLLHGCIDAAAIQGTVHNLRQFGNGDEHIAFGGHVVNGFQGSIHAVFFDVVHLNDITGGGILDSLEDGFRFIIIPIQSVQRPHDDAQSVISANGLGCAIIIASGGTQQPYRNIPRQSIQLIANLFADLVFGELGQVGMAFCMQSDFVSILGDQGWMIRVLLDPVAAQEESGLGIALLQSLQQSEGGITGGAVIKGQRYILDFDSFTAECTAFGLAICGFSKGVRRFSTAGCIAAFADFSFDAGGWLPVMSQWFSFGGDAIPADGRKGALGCGVTVFQRFTFCFAAYLAGLGCFAGWFSPHMIAVG